MGNTVIVLGAGASKMAGAPLMDGFFETAEDTAFDVMWDKSWPQVYGWMTDQFRCVLDARDLLQSAHSKGDIDLYNLESVFSAFEIAKLYGRLGPLEQSDLDQLPDAMRQVIATTLEWNIRFGEKWDHIRDGFGVPEPYGDFAEMIWGIAAKWNYILNFGKIRIITFNYDICLDYALRCNGVSFEYCLEDSPLPMRLWLLKLHGSLNWAYCPKCQAVIAVPIDALPKSCWDTTPYHAPRLFASRALRDFEHCGSKTGALPLIALPSWNKHPYYSQVGSIWHASANALADAENIFVFGYSMPPTDQFFRYLYSIGTIGRAPLRRFWVFDPDETGTVEDRFRRLLGLGAARRFRYYRLTFDQAIAELSRELELPQRDSHQDPPHVDDFDIT